MDHVIPHELVRVMGEAPDWRYEMRREAQEILPSLFIGPFQISRDLARLQQLGITHICCVSELRESHLVKPRFPDHFVYLTLDVRDASDQNLITIFPRAKAFIDMALSGGGKVLVHCGDGISRSPALVTAYVMVQYRISHDDAFQFVQSRRFCISPNAGFLHQLEAYEPIYRASLALATHSELARPISRRKRDDPEEEDLEQVENSMDIDTMLLEERAAKRPAAAP